MPLAFTQDFLVYNLFVHTVGVSKTSHAIVNFEWRVPLLNITRIADSC